VKKIPLAICLVAIGSTAASGFKDIECKAKADMMITKPGTYERVVTLADQGKMNAAKQMVVCMTKKGRGVFIVGKPARGKESFVPVSTGDCIGETYRPHLLCPGDKAVAKKPRRRASLRQGRLSPRASDRSHPPRSN
jgi:hypothetical protein